MTISQKEAHALIEAMRGTKIDTVIIDDPVISKMPTPNEAADEIGIVAKLCQDTVQFYAKHGRWPKEVRLGVVEHAEWSRHTNNLRHVNGMLVVCVVSHQHHYEIIK